MGGFGFGHRLGGARRGGDGLGPYPGQRRLCPGLVVAGLGEVPRGGGGGPLRRRGGDAGGVHGLGPFDVGLGGGQRRRPDRVLVGLDRHGQGGGRVRDVLFSPDPTSQTLRPAGRPPDRGPWTDRPARRVVEILLGLPCPVLCLPDLRRGGVVGLLASHRRGLHRLVEDPLRGRPGPPGPPVLDHGQRLGHRGALASASASTSRAR